MALKGETPAQKAGLDFMKEKDKWMELLKLAQSANG